MANHKQKIAAAGGLEDGSIGTDALRIIKAIQEVYSEDGVVIMVDLGSAVLSSETALDMLDDFMRQKIRIADAPILEGTISAAVQASIGSSLEEVLATAQAARDMQKL